MIVPIYYVIIHNFKAKEKSFFFLDYLSCADAFFLGTHCTDYISPQFIFNVNTHNVYIYPPLSLMTPGKKENEKDVKACRRFSLAYHTWVMMLSYYKT